MPKNQWSDERSIDQVREFHEAFGLPIADEPGLPSDQQTLLRENLLSEEYWEYRKAVDENDLVEIADALADMVYIICGTALVYGIPLNEVFSEVHRSNMSKLDEDGSVLRRDDGKVLKGRGYSPPDIASILKRRVADDMAATQT